LLVLIAWNAGLPCLACGYNAKIVFSDPRITSMTTPENKGKAPRTPAAPKSASAIPPATATAVRHGLHPAIRIALGALGVLLALPVTALLILAFMVTLAYPKLPDLDSLTDYRPKIPLRVFSADGVLIGEFAAAWCTFRTFLM